MRRLAFLLLFCAATLRAEPLPAQGTVEAAFTPWDDAEGLVLRCLRDARQSVRVQAYLLTSRNIAFALQQARDRGVDVRVLADKEMTEQGDNSLVPQLASSGIPVRLETRYGAAHNKVIVVDGEGDNPVVLTGSYNYTWSAQARNAENLLVLRGNAALARAYRNNWQRHWDDALPYGEAGVANASGGRGGRNAAARTPSPCGFLPADERRLLAEDCRH